jgi:hypothetical protein
VPPEVQLRDALINHSYERVGHVYHPDWAMHQFALQNRLGPPMAPPFRFAAQNQVWQAELYGTDAICSPTNGTWKDIRRLSQLDDGELKTVLRAESYKQLGVQYHPDWTMHQFADRNKIGLPLTENFPLSMSDGRSFAVQIFQLDTIFSPAGKWNTVLPLSGLTDATNLKGPDADLRDLLLNQQYIRIGNRYHPDWDLHRIAIQQKLGAPLTDQEKLTVNHQDYMVASYARDVLYTPSGDWRLVQRLSDLITAVNASNSPRASFSQNMGGEL